MTFQRRATTKYLVHVKLFLSAEGGKKMLRKFKNWHKKYFGVGSTFYRKIAHFESWLYDAIVSKLF